MPARAARGAPDRMAQANVTAVLGAFHARAVRRRRALLVQPGRSTRTSGRLRLRDHCGRRLRRRLNFAGRRRRRASSGQASTPSLRRQSGLRQHSRGQLAGLLLDVDGRRGRAYVKVAEELAVRSDVLVQFLRRSGDRLLARRRLRRRSLAREAVAISSLDALVTAHGRSCTGGGPHRCRGTAGGRSGKAAEGAAPAREGHQREREPVGSLSLTLTQPPPPPPSLGTVPLPHGAPPFVRPRSEGSPTSGQRTANGSLTRGPASSRRAGRCVYSFEARPAANSRTPGGPLDVAVRVSLRPRATVLGARPERRSGHAGVRDGDEAVRQAPAAEVATREIFRAQVELDAETGFGGKRADVAGAEPVRLATTLDRAQKVALRLPEDIVERDETAGRETGSEKERPQDSRAGDVHRDADPEHERPRLWVEACREQALEDVVALEIGFDVGQALGPARRRAGAFAAGALANRLRTSGQQSGARGCRSRRRGGRAAAPRPGARPRPARRDGASAPSRTRTRRRRAAQRPPAGAGEAAGRVRATSASLRGGSAARAGPRPPACETQRRPRQSSQAGSSRECGAQHRDGLGRGSTYEQPVDERDHVHEAGPHTRADVLERTGHGQPDIATGARQ